MPSNRIVAITGASAGIGRATALRLARGGSSVVLGARRRDRLDRLVGEVAASGGQALAVPGDVTRQADMQALVAAAVDRFGRLDVMLCNAGFGVAGAIDAVSADQIRRLMEVNFLGTCYAARAALAEFRRRGRGHLVVVSSIVGRRGVPYMGAYAATKFAQVGFAESLRSEVAGSDIHVTLVFPVSTETEFFDVMSRESGATVASRGPRQSPDTVAASIVRAIERPVPEVYPYRKAWGLVLLNVLAPGFCDRFVKRFGRRPMPSGSGQASGAAE